MRLLKTIVKVLVGVIVCLFAAAQFKRPARTNPPIDHAQAIEAHTQMKPEVASILDRSCNDCHSNRTAWPWYTNVAPLSWFIADHVDEGRKRLNFSDWGRYDQQKRSKRLQDICEQVESDAMPLSSYLPLHRKAKLSPEDRKALCDWAQAERARLE